MIVLFVGLFFLSVVGTPYVMSLLLSRFVSPSGSSAQKTFVTEQASIIRPADNEAAITV